MATKLQIRTYAEKHGVSRQEAKEHFINEAINRNKNLGYLDQEFFTQMKNRGGYDPIITEYVPHEGAVQYGCFQNAKSYIEEHGGELVYGWGIMPYLGSSMCKEYREIGIAELHQHIIVKQDDRYIDPTPYGADGIGVDMKTGQRKTVNDINFTRWFWQDDSMNPDSKRQDNTIWVPNTLAGQRYIMRCPDIQHITAGVLGNLDPNVYAYRNSYGFQKAVA